MPGKQTELDRFVDLTWEAIEEWAGWKLVSRGRTYQRRGRVSDLIVTDDVSLIAWVDGTQRYTSRVVMDEDGLPASICTCPYCMDCKHGVAVVIEYLKRIEEKRLVPKAQQHDVRLEVLEEDRLGS